MKSYTTWMSEVECALQISSLSTCSQQSTIFHLIPHYSFQFFDCIFFTVLKIAFFSFNFHGIFFFLFILLSFLKHQYFMLFYIYSTFITIIFTLISIDFHRNESIKKWYSFSFLFLFVLLVSLFFTFSNSVSAAV